MPTPKGGEPSRSACGRRQLSGGRRGDDSRRCAAGSVLVGKCAAVVRWDRPGHPRPGGGPCRPESQSLALGGSARCVVVGGRPSRPGLRRDRGSSARLVRSGHPACAGGWCRWIPGFIIHQLRSRTPSLDVRLFKDRGLAAGSIIVTAQFFASLGLFVLAPQYLQLVQSYTPLGSAVALLLIPVGVGAGIGLSVALGKRFGARAPGSLGLALISAGFAVFALGLPPGLDASISVLASGLLVFGVGFGMGITPGTQLIIDGLPSDRRSVASAVNDITREVGGVLGIAVLSSVLLSFYRADIEPALVGSRATGPGRQLRRWGGHRRREHPGTERCGFGRRRAGGICSRSERIDVGRGRCAPRRLRRCWPCGPASSPAPPHLSEPANERQPPARIDIPG